MSGSRSESLGVAGHLPLYAVIQRTLEGRVVDGTYPVGSWFPTEVELAEEFSAGRSTIREALRYLTDRGYLQRRQGVGTRVISDTIRRNFFQSFATLEELFQIAAQTFYVVHDIRAIELDLELSELVGGVQGEIWLRINGVRWTEAGGRPICYVQSYVPHKFEAIVATFPSLQGPFFRELERHSPYPIEQVQQEIRAILFPDNMVRDLGLKAGAVSLQLLRRYVTTDGVLIASFNWHPADQMTYTMRIQSELSRGDGGQPRAGDT